MLPGKCADPVTCPLSFRARQPTRSGDVMTGLMAISPRSVRRYCLTLALALSATAVPCAAAGSMPAASASPPPQASSSETRIVMTTSREDARTDTGRLPMQSSRSSRRRECNLSVGARLYVERPWSLTAFTADSRYRTSSPHDTWGIGGLRPSVDADSPTRIPTESPVICRVSPPYAKGTMRASPTTGTPTMLKFYYSLAPNPMKVALFLEEVGLPYEAIPVETRKGEQHAAAFVALNPNAKVPVIVDGAVTVFDSNAILLYLAEKTGQFLPAQEDRGPMLSWLMFVASGIGPFSGQSVHFKHYAPEPNPYSLNRYDFEAWRHWKILDARLANRPWMVSERYTLRSEERRVGKEGR